MSVRFVLILAKNLPNILIVIQGTDRQADNDLYKLNFFTVLPNDLFPLHGRLSI